MSHIIGYGLIVYSWIAAAILVLVLFLIGRFYELRYGQRSYYQLFLIPLFLFLVGAVWDAFFANGSTEDPLLDFVGALGPDLLFLFGGLALAAQSYLLFRTMIGARK